MSARTRRHARSWLSSPDLDRVVLAAVVQKLMAAGQLLGGVAGA